MQTLPGVEEQVARCIEEQWDDNSVVTGTHDDTRDRFLRGACVSIGGCSHIDALRNNIVPSQNHMTNTLYDGNNIMTSGNLHMYRVPEFPRSVATYHINYSVIHNLISLTFFVFPFIY